MNGIATIGAAKIAKLDFILLKVDSCIRLCFAAAFPSRATWKATNLSITNFWRVSIRNFVHPGRKERGQNIRDAQKTAKKENCRKIKSHSKLFFEWEARWRNEIRIYFLNWSLSQLIFVAAKCAIHRQWAWQRDFSSSLIQIELTKEWMMGREEMRSARKSIALNYFRFFYPNIFFASFWADRET